MPKLKHTIPAPIANKQQELEQLIEQYPEYIPVPALAKFLNANVDGLRKAIEQRRCPFGIMWQKDLRGNKSFKVPTFTFYMWYTQSTPYAVGQ